MAVYICLYIYVSISQRQNKMKELFKKNLISDCRDQCKGFDSQFQNLSQHNIIIKSYWLSFTLLQMEQNKQLSTLYRHLMPSFCNQIAITNVYQRCLFQPLHLCIGFNSQVQMPQNLRLEHGTVAGYDRLSPGKTYTYLTALQNCNCNLSAQEDYLFIHPLP